MMKGTGYPDVQLSSLDAGVPRSRVISRLNSLNRDKQLQDWTPEWENAAPPSEALLALRRISASLRSQPPVVDMFELRQAVMRYTNPLRAKILLFSLLHSPYQFDRVEQGLLLKSYELDKLLERALQTYTQFTLLSAELQKTARQLEHPDDYRQTATAILRAIKPFYVSSAASKSLPPLPESESFNW